MSLPRALTLALAVSLFAMPGLAENVWSRTETPSGPATYPTPDTVALALADAAPETPAPQASRPIGQPQGPVPRMVLAAAPDFNSWQGGPGYGAPTGGGFPFFCGSFGFGGRNGGGFSFGF